jgi:cell volume regulation protein A
LGIDEMVDISIVFAIVAGIIAIAFIGEILFKKTGVPIFIFLILTGIIIGPILNIFPREPLIETLSIFATLTLIMVLFHGGMGLESTSVVASGARAFVQTIIYVLSSIALISAIGIFFLKWDILPSLLFASMIGGETTAAVVVPLCRSMKLRESAACFLTMESAMNSIFSVILFFAFVEVYNTGSMSWLTALSNIGMQFSVGIALGLILSLEWVFVLYYLQDQKFTYVLTLGLILITYSLTTVLGGNGILAVLVFGIILGNYHLVNRLFKKRMKISRLQSQLESFHEEISFLLEALFFVFLGLTFVINSSLIAINFSIGILILATLLSTRFVATRVSTFKSELSQERKTIVLMCAQGLTPATLAVLAVTLQLPLADTFLNIVTYVIILTNVVTTIGSILKMRH